MALQFFLSFLTPAKLSWAVTVQKTGNNTPASRLSGFPLNYCIVVIFDPVSPPVQMFILEKYYIILVIFQTLIPF